MAMPTRADLDALIRDRLAQDPQFRERLTADPRGTVSELLGMPLPDGLSVTVHEESLSSIHLVVPARPGPGELTDDDLELVAGGTSCWDNCGCSV